MSYATALVRYEHLTSKLGIRPLASVRTGGFDEALQNAQTRFDVRPQRLTALASSADPTAGANAMMSRVRFGGDTSSVGGYGKATTGLTPELDAMFQRASAKHGVPAALLKAVARAESGFRSNAVSPAGAQGLMQLMPATGRGLGVTNPFDPQQSINGGARYLHNALRMFDGDPQLALAAYNAGPNAVKSHGGIPPFQETQNYVRKVMDYARQFGFTALPGAAA